jgi:NTE family protein
VLSQAEAYADKLMRLSISNKDYTDHLFKIQQRGFILPRIDKVRIDNQSSLNSDVLKSHITAKSGNQLDILTLEEDINRLYGLNIFKRVEYDLQQVQEETELAIHADEKDWGPHYLRFGLVLETDFEGTGTFTAASSFTSTPINALGGEWRSEIQVGNEQRVVTELYQPIDSNLRYYTRTSLGYYEKHLGQFESGQQLADLDFSYSEFLLAGGCLFGNWGQLELGAYYTSGDTSTLAGELSTPNQDVRQGAWVVLFFHDDLDNINIPGSESMTHIVWTANREELGSDSEKESLVLHSLWANT